MAKIKSRSILALILGISMTTMAGCQNKGIEEHSLIAVAQSISDSKNQAENDESSKYALKNGTDATKDINEETTKNTDEETINEVTQADTTALETEPAVTTVAKTEPQTAKTEAETMPQAKQELVTEPEPQPESEAVAQETEPEPQPQEVSGPQPGVALTIEQAAAISEANYNNYYGYIMQVAELINQFRAENGLAPVAVDYTDCIVAGIRSAEGAHLDYFSHERPDGSKVSTVINYYGISWERCGENLGRRQTSPEGIVDGWKNSDSGHREIMLKTEWTSMGIGVAANSEGDLYWSAVFIQN